LPRLNTDLLLEILEASAVIASAIAGMLIAADKRMDLIGAFALACVNAFGGGTVRDLLLDNRPFYWMANWGYLLAILANLHSIRVQRQGISRRRRSASALGEDGRGRSRALHRHRRRHRARA
jgi:uncharacterized membrane protein YeiH